jgi:hypothetical protein
VTVAFDRQLRHTVTIVRYTLGNEDDYGQPARTPTDVATVKALVQPRGTRLGGGTIEETTTHGAGPTITDHTIFMRIPASPPTAADEIYADAAGIHTGKTFEVKLVREAGGQHHHLELEVRLIEPEGS